MMSEKEEDEGRKKKYKESSILWRTRVFMFAKAMCDPKIKAQQNDYNVDPQSTGLPFYKYSLMEGITGQIYFLSELLRDDENLKFPGFEI